MDLSGLEFGSLAGKLSSTLCGYYVNNIYLTGGSTVIIKLHMSDRPEISLLLSPRIGAWTTMAELPRAPADRFVSDLRANLERAKFVNSRATEGERMISFDFSQPERNFALVGEFFGAGNVILLDGSSKVLACLNTLEVSNRSVRTGIEYMPPKSRSLPPGQVTIGELSGILSPSDPVERLLGRNLAIPRRIVEEALARAGIAKGRAGSSLSTDERESVLGALRGIAEESMAAGKAYVYFRGGIPVEISSVRLALGAPYEEKVYPDILEAMDGIFTPRVVEGFALEGVKPDQDDLKKLDSSISSKAEELEALRRKSTRLKEVASSIMTGNVEYGKAAIDLEPISRLRYDTGSSRWSLEGRSVEIESPYALASRVFTEAKEAEASAEKLSGALERLQKRRGELSSSIEREAGARAVTRQRRERRWFEKFRWFYTSEGFFAMGGRDAGSNGLLVRKHLEPSDLVFHTEIPGSAFFVLKGGQAAGPQSVREVAEATVSYSRAWREGLASADAYYVRPEQVRRGAPSGQYLPRGSFVVEGERSYVKGIELRVSIGVGLVDGEMMLLSGPASALVRRCATVIELVPGHLQTSEAAKKTKRELVAHLEGDERAFAEGLHIDEFIRALPTGRLRQLRVLRGEAARAEEDASSALRENH